MEKVAVLPVPDWACAITSWPSNQSNRIPRRRTQRWAKPTPDNGHDGALLNGRRPLETIGVDAAKQLGLQVHGVERIRDLVIVGLDLTCGRQTLLASCSDPQPTHTMPAAGSASSDARLPPPDIIIGEGKDIRSGTSSKPFEAMIATVMRGDDHRRCAVIYCRQWG